MFLVFFSILEINQNIVKIAYQKLIQGLIENIIHSMLKNIGALVSLKAMMLYLKYSYYIWNASFYVSLLFV